MDSLKLTQDGQAFLGSSKEELGAEWYLKVNYVRVGSFGSAFVVKWIFEDFGCSTEYTRENWRTAYGLPKVNEMEINL